MLRLYFVISESLHCQSSHLTNCDERAAQIVCLAEDKLQTFPLKFIFCTLIFLFLNVPYAHNLWIK